MGSSQIKHYQSRWHPVRSGAACSLSLGTASGHRSGGACNICSDKTTFMRLRPKARVNGGGRIIVEASSLSPLQLPLLWCCATTASRYGRALSLHFPNIHCDIESISRRQRDVIVAQHSVDRVVLANPRRCCVTSPIHAISPHSTLSPLFRNLLPFAKDWHFRK